jgi:hypothetical protein
MSGSLRILGTVLLLAALAATAPVARAVPSFARQTGMACEACHTVFPELTHFGRTFKANGYVLDNLKQVQGINARKQEMLELSQTPPLSIMLQVSYTSLAKTLPDLSNPALAGLAQSGTVAFPQQLGIFYAGKIAPHVGAFVQLTYSAAGGTIGIDNTDLRFADLVVLPSEQTVVYGVSLNNNPTIQDIWNSTPAFGFPYASSAAVVSSLAHTQIDGGLAQSVAGATGYLYWNESLYAELGGYRSAKSGTPNALTGAAGPLDGTASNVIKGVAPYWRLAYEYNVDRHSIEVGAYGLSVKLLPGGNSASPSPLSGPTNGFKDVAFDAQYQFVGDQHLFSILGTHIKEKMTLDASAAGGTNAKDDLTTWRIYGTYYFQRKIGGTVGYFSTTGSADPGLYAAIPPGAVGAAASGVTTSASGLPDTKGWVAELNYLPWLNTKLSLQYTKYSRFNGGGSNYDGAGRNADDNSTVYALVWFTY